ncbi:multidrug effflux MFS transporter [Sphingomicrobium nitratireducens]|uniref:multidrug effflux MFS transporter n=1 Tax=Sphingomicrobium nitratireducens TaxID=2964666 RepID=UPI00223F0FDF|nr:multidrug effflux MFS transporter [Sphingomicrobium nitratireducens]
MVALLAAFMALNAFALDTMLPALPDIGDSLGVTEDNRRQWVIVAYTFGFGTSQLLWGPLADRFGRKPVLTAGILLYAAFAVVCATARDFTLLVAARFGMGAAGAVSRVLVTAIVRDLYEGEAMARIMSLTFMVFMVVPVIAPSVGQGILLVGSWRIIFWALGAYGLLVLLWGTLRLPETLHPEYRRSLDPRDIGRAIAIAATDRLSVGYTLGLAAIFTTLIAYLASIQQIVDQVFGAASSIGIVFAAIAGPMGLASWANSRIVTRYGLHHVGHWGMVGFAAIALAHLAWHFAVGSSLVSFTLFMSAMLVCFAFTTANFGTLAMTNMASVAGTASSVQGMVGTIVAAAIGLYIGQHFDGTVTPYLSGVALCGIAAVAIVLATERGKLFAELPKQRSPEQERCPGPEGS